VISQQPLAGRVALVTGASRGVGRATALALAGAGADIAVSARSTEAAPSRLPGTIDETAREVRGLGRRALAVAADVTDEAQVDALAARALGEFGKVDLLVNNAAYFFPAPFHEIPQKRWDLVLDVNLRGAVLCTRALLPSMMARGSGRIVNVSSSAAEMLLPDMLGYSVSKAALEAFTRGLAAELEPQSGVCHAGFLQRACFCQGVPLG